MRGASRASYAELRERLDAVVHGPVLADLIGDELFAVVRLLDSEHGLRRALADPTKPSQEKAEVARRLLHTGRLAVVSIDTMVSGSLAGDLIGRLAGGKGNVAVTLSDLAITEHAEKREAFEATVKRYYPGMSLIETIEEHDIESEAYDKSLRLFKTHPDLAGIYITTEASIPVLEAARDANILERLIIVTTDLFPALVDYIRSGSVLATIYQRPYTQGRMAFRVLYEFLMEGSCPSYQVTFSPHLVMRGNLDFFLARQSQESAAAKESTSIDAADLEGYSVG